MLTVLLFLVIAGVISYVFSKDIMLSILLGLAGSLIGLIVALSLPYDYIVKENRKELGKINNSEIQYVGDSYLVNIDGQIQSIPKDHHVTVFTTKEKSYLITKRKIVTETTFNSFCIADVISDDYEIYINTK